MATKTKSEPTRIEHLAEVLAEHAKALEGFEAQASQFEADAVKLAARIEELKVDITRPIPEVAAEVGDLEAKRSVTQARAAAIRARAVDYRAEHQIESLENEHRYLVSQEKARVEAEATATRRAELTAEFEGRIPQYRSYLLAVEALEWRLNWLADQGVTTHRAFASRNETQSSVRWEIRNMTTDAQRQEFMRNHLPQLEAERHASEVVRRAIRQHTEEPN